MSILIGEEYEIELIDSDTHTLICVDGSYPRTVSTICQIDGNWCNYVDNESYSTMLGAACAAVADYEKILK